MRESQYQIPTSAGLHEGGAAAPEIENDAQAVVASFFVRQEKDMQVQEHNLDLYRNVKVIESCIDTYRNEALRTPIISEKTIGGRILGLAGINSRVEFPEINTLIESESQVGGQLFQVQSRFWLHSPVDTSGVRDWYFSFNQAEREYTIHYQSGKAGLKKLYNGRNYEFTDGEMERLVEAMSAYEQQVAAQVYRRSSFVLAA